ncbi:MAG: tail fiber domain-containing protein [Aeromonadaceae bacterium]
MSSQDLDKAIKSINESASRTNTTTDFFNRVLDGGKTESAQNPLTGAVVPSVQKAVYDQYKNDINQIHQDVVDANDAAARAEAAAGSAEAKVLRSDLAAPGGAGLVGGLPVFVTATKYAGGASESSTNNDAAIIAAINDAVATGSYVYWPAVYEVQGNIPNFHSVRHDGPGGIKRGSDTFKVHQLEWSHVNQLYCAASGAPGGDGLTSDFPIVGLQAALDALGGVNPAALQLGLFKLNLAAGIYSKGTFYRQIQFIQRVEISGPAPSVKWGEPTAIIDGISQPGIGLYLQGGGRWKVSHITAKGFSGKTGQGICIENGNLWAYNVRAHDNEWVGLNANFSCRLYVSGGDFYRNGHGIRTYDLTTYTVGYDATQPTVVRDNTIGFLAQNACEGHFDNATSTGNDTGVVLLNQSRTHLSGATVTGNNIGISALNGSSYTKSSGTEVSGNSSFDEICRGFSVSNEDANICVYNPANRSLVFDSGLSGLTPNSGYKYVYNFSASDAGVQYLTANNVFLISAGNADSKVAGSLRYTFSDDSWRLVNGGNSTLVVSQSAMRPWTDNAMAFGAAAYRSSVVYSATGAINTSDAREKTPSQEVTETLLDIADDISIDMWKWLESINKKGEKLARWHFGPIAQQVRDAFAKHGLDGCDYGLLCYDKWDDEFEDVLDENGDSTGDKRLVLSAGDRWGIRPDQCLWLKMAASERRAKRAEDRIAEIEEKISMLMN